MNPLVLMLTLDEQIDRRILLEAESLRSLGMEVVVWAPHSKAAPLQGEGSRPVRQGRSLTDHLVRGVWQLNKAINHVLPKGSDRVRGVKQLIWRHIVDKEAFYRSRFAGFSAERTPSIVVAHDLQTLPAAYRLARSSDARLVYDSHELFCEQEFSEADKIFWSAVERKYISSCDLVLTVNQSIAEELERRYQIRGVGVIQNAERRYHTDSHERLFHRCFALSEQDRVLLLQGGISAGRNLETLVSAMALVRDPAVHLVILGDGPLVPRLKEMTSAAGGAARVHFHPAVPQDRLLEYTAAADAGIIPYQATCLNNHFCTPNKLFEFIAAGLPIVASDLPEIRRIVQGHEIGVLGDLASPEQMAANIDRMFSDREALARFAANARSARELLCWEQEAIKYQQFLENLLPTDGRVSVADRQAMR